MRKICSYSAVLIFISCGAFRRVSPTRHDCIILTEFGGFTGGKSTWKLFGDGGNSHRGYFDSAEIFNFRLNKTLTDEYFKTVNDLLKGNACESETGNLNRSIKFIYHGDSANIHWAAGSPCFHTWDSVFTKINGEITNQK